MKSKFHRICTPWIPGLAAILLLLAGCTVALPLSNGTNIQGDTFRISFNTPQLMCGAIMVADAGVSGYGTSHWNTPDGSRPAGANQETLIRGGYAIYTPLHLSSMHIHVDHRSQPTSEFDTIGGQVGADQYSMGYPQVRPNNSYLLVFVYGINQQTQKDWKSVLVVTDAFPINSQGIVTLQGGSVEQGHTYSAVTEPLSQITQQLANCK